MTRQANMRASKPPPDDLQTIINKCIDAKKNDIFQEIFPIGSIYITSTIPENAQIIENTNDTYGPRTLQVTINGCTFKLLPPNTFIKNVNISYDYVPDRHPQYTFTTNDKYGDVGGEEAHTLTVEELPSHNHSYNTDRWYYEEEKGGNTVKSTPDNYTSNFFTRTTSNEGGGQPHNNMPPYFVVYMWKRIE